MLYIKFKKSFEPSQRARVVHSECSAASSHNLDPSGGRGREGIGRTQREAGEVLVREAGGEDGTKLFEFPLSR